MNPYLTNFYHNWTNKYNGIIVNDLSSVYDKYITLFVIFNNLYTQIPNKLISRGISVPAKPSDNELAIKIVIKFLGAETIINAINTNNLENEVASLIQLIRNEMFYIKLNHGQRDRNEDLKIIDDLESYNIERKATAILKVIYYVRCNIFHGSKDFNENQRSLVEPLIKILQVINPIIFNELSS